MERPTNPPPLSRLVDGNLETYGYHIMRGQCDYREPLWHWHRGVELAIVQSGTSQVFSGPWQQTVTAGEATLVTAEKGHGSVGRFSRTVIHFMPDVVASSEGRRLLAQLEDGSSDKGVHAYLSGEATARILWAADQLLRLPSTQRHRLTIEALMGLILADLQVCLDQPVSGSFPHTLRAAVHYMHAHPESDETIEVLAHRFGVSKGHLTDLFRDHLSCTPHQYWLGIKMERACSLLTGPTPVDEIASAVGFHSARGFTAAFRRLHGMSPSAFRRVAQK